MHPTLTAFLPRLNCFVPPEEALKLDVVQVPVATTMPLIAAAALVPGTSNITITPGSPEGQRKSKPLLPPAASGARATVMSTSPSLPFEQGPLGGGLVALILGTFSPNLVASDRACSISG